MMEASNARELVARLQAVYRGLAAQTEPDAQAKSPFRAFAGWFQSASPGETPGVYERFLREVAALTEEIAAALPAIQDERGREALALEALTVMLAPKPLNAKAQRDWYQVVAEAHASALLPFLGASSLCSIKDAYRRANPRRMMYPCQRKLLKEMEGRIGRGLE